MTVVRIGRCRWQRVDDGPHGGDPQPGDPQPGDPQPGDPHPGDPHPGDAAAVAERLGRPPAGRFRVVVRDPSGAPVVIRNAPFLDDGTPMPTRYWLLGPAERLAVSRLESAGAVAEAEAEIDPAAVADAHRRHAAERDAAVADDHVGPRPSGGVGGTARGVKCLHAHLAWWMAGGDDPVGAWTAARLAAGEWSP